MFTLKFSPSNKIIHEQGKKMQRNNSRNDNEQRNNYKEAVGMFLITKSISNQG